LRASRGARERGERGHSLPFRHRIPLGMTFDTFSFASNGDGLSEVSVVQIEKGQPKLLKLLT